MVHDGLVDIAMCLMLIVQQQKRAIGLELMMCFIGAKMMIVNISKLSRSMCCVDRELNAWPIECCRWQQRILPLNH